MGDSAGVVIANGVKQSPGNKREIVASFDLAMTKSEQGFSGWPGRMEFFGQVFAETTGLFEDLCRRYLGEREKEFRIFECGQGGESIFAINDDHGVSWEELIQHPRASATIQLFLVEGF